MPYEVLLRDNASGEIRNARIADDWDDLSLFWWTDGNLGCDCNRALVWAEVGSEAEQNVDCGMERFTAIKAILADGSEIPIDD